MLDSFLLWEIIAIVGLIAFFWLQLEKLYRNLPFS